MKPVVWALDAFASIESLDVQFRTVHAACSHIGDHEESPLNEICQIHPVYVLSEQVFSDKGYSSFLRPGLLPMARRNLEAILSHDSLFEFKKSGRLAAPQVLVEPTANASTCVRRLLDYAHQLEAKFIAVGTHARSPILRFFAGSFAETLILESSIPVLVVGGLAHESKSKCRTALLPTDFQIEHRRGFETFLNTAGDLNLDIKLIHKRPEPMDSWRAFSSNDTAFGVGFDADGLSSDGTESEAEVWVNLARSQGLSAEVISENFRESTPEAIIEYGSQLPDPTICILSQLSWLNGSILRDLIRSSPFPIYLKDFGEPTRNRDSLGDGRTSLRW